MDTSVKNSKATPKSRMTVVKGDVRKEDTKKLVVNAIDGAPDDVFANSYWKGDSDDGSGTPAILEPTFKPGQLHTLCSQNNTLPQCIEAMEVNIDGTGHSIDLIEGETEDEDEKQMLEDFFHEPYPGKSMVAIRRAFRRDLEATGCGYIEVIRNASNEIILLNHLEAASTRLIRYDDAVDVTRTVRRRGKEVSVSMKARERRFVQDINGKKVYFKQFGAERDLDRLTGKWAEKGARLPAEKRATEVLYVAGNLEPKTPYGTPRWINQMPSVLGSRKAEEHNLEFFDAGGLPPVLVMIQGGIIGPDVRQELVSHLSGKKNNRAAVVEVESSSGSLDSAGSVSVRVERFGAERQQDAMFQNYDKSTEEHVRTAFRLPPLFTGKAGDYSFATAYASYLVAEAQVFWPEREEFDSLINNTVVKALGAKKYRFRSLPLTIVDLANQLKALEMVDGKYINGESFVAKLNELVGLGLEYEEQKKEPPPPPNQPPPGQVLGANTTQPALPDANGQAGVGNAVAKSDIDLESLADRWLVALGMEHPNVEFTTSEMIDTVSVIKSLSHTDSSRFNTILATKAIRSAGVDIGLGDLCGCANSLVAGHDHQC